MLLQVADYIRNLAPYIPGKPIEETQREHKLKKVVKLASNENPLGASPKAVLAIRKNLQNLHRYPDASGFLTKQALCEKLGVFTKNLILGNGSNELIDLLVRTFCVPGDFVVSPRASFIAYQLSAQIQGVTYLDSPIDSELRVDLDELVKKVRDHERTKIVFLANPNNPTGTYINQHDLKSFIAKLSQIRDGSVILVIDDAYGHYVSASDFPKPQEYLKDYQNLVILRTFSKIYGLASMRIGYGVASAEMVGYLEKVRQPFNVNSLALVAATAALSDDEFIAKSKKQNALGLKLWEEKLAQLGIPFWKSQGNFLLVDVQKGCGISGVEFYQKCLMKGLIVRPLQNYGLIQAVRITVGTAQENRFAFKVIESYLMES